MRRVNVHDTISGAAGDIAHQVAEGGCGEAIVEPGNATRYHVIVVHLGIDWFDGAVLIALPNFYSCFRVDDGSDLASIHYSYVAEKLRLNEGDARVIAELLDAVNDDVRTLGGIA